MTSCRCAHIVKNKNFNYTNNNKRRHTYLFHHYLFFLHSSGKSYPKWMFWKKRRYVVATIAFFGFFNAYALRANLSIAIVAMTENKTVVFDNYTVVYVSFNNVIVFKC
jgi:hypothetical protein